MNPAWGRLLPLWLRILMGMRGLVVTMDGQPASEVDSLSILHGVWFLNHLLGEDPPAWMRFECLHSRDWFFVQQGDRGYWITVRALDRLGIERSLTGWAPDHQIALDSFEAWTQGRAVDACMSSVQVE